MLLSLEICSKYTEYPRNMPLLWEQFELEIVVNAPFLPQASGYGLVNITVTNITQANFSISVTIACKSLP